MVERKKAERLPSRKQRRAAFFAESRKTRGSWAARAKPSTDIGETYWRNVALKERRILARTYRLGEWVVELGRSIRRFVNGPGPRGVVPEKVSAFSFADRPTIAITKPEAPPTLADNERLARAALKRVRKGMLRIRNEARTKLGMLFEKYRRSGNVDVFCEIRTLAELAF